MLMTLAAVAAALAFPAPSAAGPAAWDARELGEGHWEFRLANDEGAELVLVCRIDGVTAGFEFSEAVDVSAGAFIHGVPGGRRNIAVAPVGDREVRLTSTRGLELLLRALRNTANVVVRVGREQASFEVFGSSPIVSECLDRQRPDSC